MQIASFLYSNVSRRKVDRKNIEIMCLGCTFGRLTGAELLEGVRTLADTQAQKLENEAQKMKEKEQPGETESVPTDHEKHH